MSSRRTPSWIELDPSARAPPLDASLTGWEIHKKRKSHWNASRAESGKVYFLKWFFHFIGSNPARREWRNARTVASLGIPTVLPVGWGFHSRGSFIVLEGSPGAPADAWMRGDAPLDVLLRHANSLATYTATLHDAGLCHKDLNVYHVLVNGRGIRLIDVGRVARYLRRRWIVKDLASLRASARREGFPEHAARLFLRTYLASTRRRWVRSRFLRAIIRKAERYRRHHERE